MCYMWYQLQRVGGTEKVYYRQKIAYLLRGTEARYLYRLKLVFQEDAFMENANRQPLSNILNLRTVQIAMIWGR